MLISFSKVFTHNNDIFIYIALLKIYLQSTAQINNK